MSVKHSVSSDLRAIMYSGEVFKIQIRLLYDKQIACWSFDGTLRRRFPNSRWKLVVVNNGGRLFQICYINTEGCVCVCVCVWRGKGKGNIRKFLGHLCTGTEYRNMTGPTPPFPTSHVQRGWQLCNYRVT